MAYPGTRTQRNDGSSTVVIATHEPLMSNGANLPQRVLAIETQSVSDGSGQNPTVTLGTPSGTDDVITLPSQRPSGHSNQS